MSTALEGLDRARGEVRRKLVEAARDLGTEGCPRPALDGKVLRPLTAYLLVPPELRSSLDHRFWMGCLAVEMVHEASLLHDDILDEASERRGKPTMAAAAGVGPALVQGDHLLTAAYRAAAATESPEFLEVFIRSVERTVAGEIAQEKSQGRFLDEEEYLAIITGKSGELFRSAFSLAPSLLRIASPELVGSLGARFGALYQMVDDLLDYCQGTDRGKPPLQDYRQKKWTWPLGLIPVSDFDAPKEEVLSLLFAEDSSGDPTPLEVGAASMSRRFHLLVEELSEAGMETSEIEGLLGSWQDLMERTTRREVVAQRATRIEASTKPERDGRASLVERPPIALLRWELRIAAEELSSPEGRLAYFGRHAKSFRFASRMFPKDQLEKVSGVYAFCRFTDDLVDEAGEEDPGLTGARLDLWQDMARTAYGGEATGIPLLDEVMSEMEQAGVPFFYAEELMEGVRMDLEGLAPHTMRELRIYSFRVASAVGGWLTELFGIRDPWVLNRAFALGHAMQLTNILRDVGEDLERDRLYLPEDLMRQYGVDRELLEAKARSGAPTFPGYRQLLERLMADAESDYDRAFEAIPSLPPFFQGPVAVAAEVYRGIHQEIRKNDYDNLNQRARTSLIRKLTLAFRGLWNLRKARARQPFRPEGQPAVLPGLEIREERRATT